MKWVNKRTTQRNKEKKTVVKLCNYPLFVCVCVCVCVCKGNILVLMMWRHMGICSMVPHILNLGTEWATLSVSHRSYFSITPSKRAYSGHWFESWVPPNRAGPRAKQKTSCSKQWRTQEFCSGGSTIAVVDRGQRERGSGGGSPRVRGSGGSCNLVQEI
jgi:hypothetical protein